MSYRRLKRLLGETNFELKVLVLFGTGLTLLAVATFFLYRSQTTKLLDRTTRSTARSLATALFLKTHFQYFAPEMRFEALIDELNIEVQPEDLRALKGELFHAEASAAGVAHKFRPTEDRDWEAWEKLRTGEKEVVKEIGGEVNQYQYYTALYASKSCFSCHNHEYYEYRFDAEGHEIKREIGDFLGVAKITLPLDRVRASLARTNAFVISAELLKVVLAIVAIYLVLRYVVTKPVMHLKRVSDAIAHGKLDMRADIRTGDEFEELSHAFNRMLRHLVTVQEELRSVNADLDGKVDELARVNLRLYELNNIKNEFLATMSHELRTPLNSILGFSDVLNTADNLSDKQRRYVGNIQIAGRTLLSLINDVLDLAKIESGKMELHLVETSLTDLIERQSGAMAPQAEKKNIELTWQVEPDVPLLFQDVGKLQQILNNLLSNAIKFTPEGGRVRVRAGRRDEQRFFFEVEDTGIGIPLEEQERIFEKFRQGRLQPGQEDALTRQFEGTGLGLSIVKELCKLLGGEITLVSEFGKGSTFTILLPLRLELLLSPTEENGVRTGTASGLSRIKPEEISQRAASPSKTV
ncbi:MAG: ATP-binding protein [Planctomycetaceae bacterium]